AGGTGRYPVRYASTGVCNGYRCIRHHRARTVGHRAKNGSSGPTLAKGRAGHRRNHDRAPKTAIQLVNHWKASLKSVPAFLRGRRTSGAIPFLPVIPTGAVTRSVNGKVERSAFPIPESLDRPPVAFHSGKRFCGRMPRLGPLELEVLPARRQYRAASSIVKRKKYSQMKSKCPALATGPKPPGEGRKRPGMAPGNPPNHAQSVPEGLFRYTKWTTN